MVLVDLINLINFSVDKTVTSVLKKRSFSEYRPAWTSLDNGIGGVSALNFELKELCPETNDLLFQLNFSFLARV